MLSTAGWQKASYCKKDCCVEALFRTSTYSVGGGCVEVGSEIKVRDSKLGDTSPILNFTPGQWNGFLAGLK